MASGNSVQKVEQDHETRLQLVEKDIGELRGAVGRIEKLLNDSSTTQKGDRRYVWGVVITVVLGVCGMIIGPCLAGLSLTLGLFVDGKTAPLERDMAAATSAIRSMTEVVSKLSESSFNLTAASASSLKDREGLLRVQENNVGRIGHLEQQLASAVSTYDARLAESETQLQSVENANALMHWHQEVINHIISQNKGVQLPLLEMPSVTISNRKPLPEVRK